MSFTDFLRVIRARWILATSIFAALTLAALIGSLVWPKKYTAQATLMIDLKVDPVAGTSATGVMPSAAFLSTQVDIIESQHVAQKVISNLQLANDAGLRGNWEKQGSKGDFASAIIMHLEGRPLGPPIANGDEAGQGDGLLGIVFG